MSPRFRTPTYLSSLLLFCWTALPALSATTPPPSLPPFFELNRGQAEPEALYIARVEGASWRLGPSGATLHRRGADGQSRRWTLRYGGARTKGGAHAVALEPLAGVSNYFVGTDPEQWRTAVPQFGRVRFAAVYPGIDVEWHTATGGLEFDFLVAPGANPADIAWSFPGTDEVHLDEAGDLHATRGEDALVLRRPVSYQLSPDGVRKHVSSSYRVGANGEIGIDVGPYDRTTTLIVDPLVLLSSTFGSASFDGIDGVVTDSGGSVFLAGDTISTGADGEDTVAAFVAKLDPTGRSLVYFTVLDGKSSDESHDVAVDPAGNAYTAGRTASRDFPLLNAFQTDNPNGIPSHLPGAVAPHDGFVASLDRAGKLRYSTYLGGRDYDEIRGLAVDASGRAYVTGLTDSNNFPLRNEFQAPPFLQTPSAFLTVLAAAGNSLVYSTVIGGNREVGIGNDEQGLAVAVDALGFAYVAGETNSTDFPVRGANGTPAFQPINRGGQDAFVAKFDPSSSGSRSLVYSTYLGGAGTDAARGIIVDSTGSAWITGASGSSNYPLRAAPGAAVLDATNVVNEMVISRLNANGSGLLFSTFLGGSGAESGRDLELDRSGALYVTGETSSPDFPVVAAFQDVLRGSRNVVVVKIAPTLDRLLWSSYLGGRGDDRADALALDGRNQLWVAGETTSGATFPVSNANPDLFGSGARAGFFSKIQSTSPDTVGVYRPSEGRFFLRDSNSAGPADHAVTLGAAGDRPVAGSWFGVGDRPGVYHDEGAAGIFRLKTNLVDSPCCVLTVQNVGFGGAGDQPITADWDGDGLDEIGVVQGNLFLLRFTNQPGLPDLAFNFGLPGDIPLAGDWDGDGSDTVGVYRAPTGEFLLRNSNDFGGADLTIAFGQPGDLPVVGDWDGDGVDTLGVYRGATFLLRNSNSPGAPDLTFDFGLAGDLPVAGDWDSRP